jgi:hypothetical protein
MTPARISLVVGSVLAATALLERALIKAQMLGCGNLVPGGAQ